MLSAAPAETDITTERKIENATEGLSSSRWFNLLHNKVLPTNKENTLTICDYISSLKAEINPSDHEQRGSQCYLPKPILEMLGNPRRIKFIVRGKRIEVEAAASPRAQFSD